MPAIWVLISMTQTAWNKLPPAKKKQVRKLAKDGHKGLAKAVSRQKIKKVAKKAAKAYRPYTTLTPEGRKGFLKTIKGMH